MTELEVIYLMGFDQSDKLRVDSTIKLLEEVINSDEFAERVLSAPSMKKRKIKRKTGNKKYSRREILELIRSGEDLQNPPDGVINMKLELYDDYRNEIGHTDMNKLVIRTHKEFFRKKPIEKYAAHLLHEYMHVIGFTHSKFDLFGQRSKTVPYRIGQIVSDILEK